ncbi:MAG TPA: periplasmic heavy metal sensor [Armatimonadota bacterium]|nr:periplasmic heavy metal sensor [Armatimonadota bacterium]HOP80905.1 periplasmic heavy metal sensor [Armatimonadota bacterium]HPP75916.1 periplasmic heavy metal sensor [Armatimonadota bacterium]
MKRMLALVAAATLLLGLGAAMLYGQLVPGATRPSTNVRPSVEQKLGPKPGIQTPVPPATALRGDLSYSVSAIIVPQSSMFPYIGPYLGLEDGDLNKLKTILTNADKTLGPLRFKLWNANQALRDAVLADKYDANKVKELAAAAHKAEADLLNAEVEVWTQIRTIVNGESAKKLRNIMTGNPQGHPGYGGTVRPGFDGPPPEAAL